MLLHTYELSSFALQKVRNGSDLPKKSFLSSLCALNCMITCSCGLQTMLCVIFNTEQVISQQSFTPISWETWSTFNTASTKHTSCVTKWQLPDLIQNKNAKLTQNMPVVFVVNSKVMTTFLEAGYSTWRADTAYSVFRQFKGHNSGVPGGIWQVIEQDIIPTNIFTKFDKDRMKTQLFP